MLKAGTEYGPEAIEQMISVLNTVWEALPIYSKRRMKKSVIAQRILEAVADGEKDHMRLQAAALTGTVVPFIAPAMKTQRRRIL